MLASRWDDKSPPPRLNRWSAAHHNTLANPKMILTFLRSGFSHCGWLDNNFSASCVAAARQLRQLHTQLISWTSLTSRVSATSQVREPPGDAEMRASSKKRERRVPTVLGCPLIWMIKAPTWTPFFTGVALTGLSYSWQGAWEQMVAAAKLRMRTGR